MTQSISRREIRSIVRTAGLDHAEFCVAQAQGQGLPCVAAHDELIWLRAARETRLFMSQINN